MGAAIVSVSIWRISPVATFSRSLVTAVHPGVVGCCRTSTAWGHAAYNGMNRDCRPAAPTGHHEAPRAHLTFWAPVQCRFCLAERGYEGSRGLQPTDRW